MQVFGGGVDRTIPGHGTVLKRYPSQSDSAFPSENLLITSHQPHCSCPGKLAKREKKGAVDSEPREEGHGRLS